LIEDSITTCWEETIQTTSVRGSITVEGSIVTLFPVLKNSISALGSANGVATIHIIVVSIVALFIWIKDSISTSWEATVNSACSSSNIAVHCSVITRFVCIDDSITAIRFDTVGSAASGTSRCIGICSVVVARFIDTPEAGTRQGFQLSVSTRTVGKLGEFINKLLKEVRGGRVGVGGVVWTVEKD
jgi:hypothetical protein